MSLHPEWFQGDDFVMVHPAAVAHLDGDVVAVYVLARLRYRARVFGYERNGRQWWRVSAPTLAEDLGLPLDRVKRTLRDLVRLGAVDTAKHRECGPYDQTRSYALVFRGMADGANLPDRCGESASSHGADLPDVHGADSPLLPIRSEELEETPLPLAPLAVPVDIFEDFWQTYPRRIGEGAARRAWARALTHTPAETILDGARAYAASTLPEPRYIPAPAKWLTDHRWTDDLPAQRGETPERGTAADGTPPPDLDPDDPAAYQRWLVGARKAARA